MNVVQVGVAQRVRQTNLAVSHEWGIADRRFPERINQRHAFLALDDQGAARNLRIEVAELIGRVIERRIDFVAQAVVQCEVGADTPFILDESAVVVAEGLAIGAILGLVSRGDIAEKEIGESLGIVGAVEVVVAVFVAVQERNIVLDNSCFQNSKPNLTLCAPLTQLMLSPIRSSRSY